MLHIQHIWYIWHILVHSVPVHTQAARRAFRPWSATGSVVAARQELKLLLGSIARQCGPIVSGCTAPTCEMSPVNGAIGLVNSQIRCNPPPLPVAAAVAATVAATVAAAVAAAVAATVAAPWQARVSAGARITFRGSDDSKIDFGVCCPAATLHKNDI